MAPNIAEITHYRLEGWKKKLEAQTATPLALIGIGQGQNKGEIVLCIPELGPCDQDVARILRFAADQLSKSSETPRVDEEVTTTPILNHRVSDTTYLRTVELARTLERENAKLREALKPLAGVAPFVVRMKPTTGIWVHSDNHMEPYVLSVADVNRAAEAMQ